MKSELEILNFKKELENEKAKSKILEINADQKNIKNNSILDMEHEISLNEIKLP